MEYLASIPIKTIVDFRAASEINSAPDKMPVSVQERYELSISPGNLQDIIMRGDITQDNLETAMTDMYKLMVTDNDCVKQFREFFNLLKNEGNLPLLYHCTAGKVRTGIASALLLSALGVDRETVTEDYLLSNKYVSVKYAAYIEQFPVLKPVFEVRGPYLDAAFDKIEQEYGSLNYFITDILDTDIERLREIYLY
ncbi:MAG: tyrosine-protein phosphatase [Rikenellaceae bacterium]|nr:tyrosine-protein phosphatase [Rikenellaceae bacterium]